MNLDLISGAATALSEFSGKLGISVDASSVAEDANRFTIYVEDFATGPLRSLQLTDIQRLAGAFQDALSLVVRVGDYEILSVSGDCTADTFEAFHRDATTNTVILDVDIDKRRLCQIAGLSEAGKRYFVFFAHQRFVGLLETALIDPSQLESSLWDNSLDKRCLVLLPDHDVRLVGPFLSVHGGSHLGEIVSVGPVTDAELKRAAKTNKACRTGVRWERRFASFLVPRCLRVDGGIVPSDPVVKAVLTLWANLSVLFTADRVQYDHTACRMLATYATEKVRCEIELASRLGATSRPFCDAVPALGDIAEWAYDEKWGGDRLRMVQISIARSLSYGEQPRPSVALIAQSLGIRDELEWRWKTFISDEIERFSEEERNLEEEVAKTVEAFDGEVADMIKSLSGTVLAAVGVLIGSVIAAAFKDHFNATVFSLGILAYVGYVVLFPGAYNMTHHVLRFRTLCGRFSSCRRRFERALAPEVVEDIVANRVAKAERRFWRWFGVTILAFVVVIVACLWANCRVPVMLAKSASGAGPAVAKPSPQTPPVSP